MWVCYDKKKKTMWVCYLIPGTIEFRICNLLGNETNHVVEFNCGIQYSVA